jgi:hypothetical protein
MSHHPDDDLLLDLVLDLLPREKEEQVLDHVAHCAACESRMRSQAGEMERLVPEASATALRHAAILGRTQHGLGASAEHPGLSVAERIRGWLGGPWTARRILPLGGLAGSLALILILLIPRGPTIQSQIEANWLPSSPALVQRGGTKDNALSGRLAEGLAAYNRHDLANAIRNLEEATVPYELEPFRRLYLANALTISGDYAQAVKVLRRYSPDFLPEPWATEGYWTLLVAFERSGRRASADSLRRLLATRPGQIGERIRSLR